MFGNMRSLNLWQILNHKILTRNWTKKNICSIITKTEMQLYKREVVILLNIVLNFKWKHIIKGAIAQTETKPGKLSCESNLSEDPNIY